MRTLASARQRKEVAEATRRVVEATDPDHFQARLLQDMVGDATAVWWRQRAQAYEDYRPRPGDDTGQATREQLSWEWRELTEIALACRNRAELALQEHRIDDEVWEALGLSGWEQRVAEAMLRVAIATGDVELIVACAAVVDRLDETQRWRPPASDEPTSVLIARHSRAIAAVDAHTSQHCHQEAA